jgi:O-methyltransferase
MRGLLQSFLRLGAVMSRISQYMRLASGGLSAGELDPHLARLARDSFWHYHTHHTDHEFSQFYLGFRLTRRPNDISRRVRALEESLTKNKLRGRSLDLAERVQILEWMVSKLAHDRAPLILLAEALLQQGRPLLAFEVIRRALERDAYCEVSHGVLLLILRQMPCALNWRGFFERAGSPSVCDLSHNNKSSELLDYLVEFVRAVTASEAPDRSERLDAIRLFFHRWWRVYRHEDCRIGGFAVYGSSDQSQPIGALRHVIEFSAYMQLARDAGEVDENGEVFHRRCCNLALVLESHTPDLPVLLLVVDHLAALGRLEEAHDRAHRARNLNTRCPLTQHVIAFVKHALEQRQMREPVCFSLQQGPLQPHASKFYPVPDVESRDGAPAKPRDTPEHRAAFFNSVIEDTLKQDHKAIFWGDRLLTLDKSAGFLDRQDFSAALEQIRGSHIYDQYNGEGTIAWRLHTLVWAAQHAIHVPGDFIECGVFKGDMSWFIATLLGERLADRRFLLFDSFEGLSLNMTKPDDYPDNPGFIGFANSVYSEPGLYERVCKRFSAMPNVYLIKGFLPEALVGRVPDRIAFLHMDLNSPHAEIDCLGQLFDRVSTGGIIVFDDYGWRAFRAQKKAEDAFFIERGYIVLELPTGQGLVIKR